MLTLDSYEESKGEDAEAEVARLEAQLQPLLLLVAVELEGARLLPHALALAKTVLSTHLHAAQAQLRLVWRRHDKELESFEEQLAMLDGLRESCDALEWRVTQTKAQPIVMPTAAAGTHARLD